MTVLAYLGMAIAGGLVMYFGISGAFHLVYYRRPRDRAAEWKCQPRRWLTPELWRQQLRLGTANVLGASIASGLFASYLAGGGRSAVYFDGKEHGAFYTVAATVFYFLLTDAGLYWAHRIYHTPFLFRHIHRVHHRFVAPNAFTAMAMHPVELATYQTVMLLPVFVLPLHVGGLILVLVYQNYVGMLDHSGVDLYSWLPWQPPTRFHDDHHVHFHVNYGQNLGLWDRIFGTYRREGRRYGVEVFGGRGLAEAGADAGPPRYVDYGRRPPAVAARPAAVLIGGDPQTPGPADAAADHPS